MEWALLIGLIAGCVIGVLCAVGSGADDYEPPKQRQPDCDRADTGDDYKRRRQPDLFTLAVGIALGAALFGDDDDE